MKYRTLFVLRVAFSYFILTRVLPQNVFPHFFFFTLSTIYYCVTVPSCHAVSSYFWLYEVSTFENLSELCETLSAAKSRPRTR